MDILEFCLTQHRQHPRATYNNVPYISNISPDDPNLIPIDVYYTKHGLSTCGYAKIPPPAMTTDTDGGHTLQTFFSTLPTAIQRICGTINFPTDNGVQLMSKCRCNNNKMFGASDASFRTGNATHAWVISSGQVSDLETPNMTYHRVWSRGWLFYTHVIQKRRATWHYSPINHDKCLIQLPQLYRNCNSGL